MPPATVNTLMPRRSFLPPGETSTGCRCADQRRATRHALDRHHARIVAGAHEGVGFLRGKAGVQRIRASQRHRHPRRASSSRPAFQARASTPRHGRCRPSARGARPATTLAAPEGPDRDLDAILLHVGPPTSSRPPAARCRCGSPRGARPAVANPGASPSSTQVSPSSVFLKVLIAAADPDSLLTAASQAAAMSASCASPRAVQRRQVKPRRLARSPAIAATRRVPASTSCGARQSRCRRIRRCRRPSPAPLSQRSCSKRSHCRCEQCGHGTK